MTVYGQRKRIQEITIHPLPDEPRMSSVRIHIANREATRIGNKGMLQRFSEHSSSTPVSRSSSVISVCVCDHVLLLAVKSRIVNGCFHRVTAILYEPIDIDNQMHWLEKESGESLSFFLFRPSFQYFGWNKLRHHYHDEISFPRSLCRRDGELDSILALQCCIMDRDRSSLR